MKGTRAVSVSYVCAARSNNFEVKREYHFGKWAEKLEGLWVETVYLDPETDGAVVSLHMETGELWPRWAYDEASGFREVDFIGELSRHLALGEVAVLSVAGFEEGSGRLIGESLAVNDCGEVIKVQLSDIDDRIRENGWPDPAYVRDREQREDEI